MSKPPVINGRRSAVIQPIHYGTNESGAFTIIPYEGTAREIQQIAAQWAAVGAYHDVQLLPGGLAKLEVRLNWLFNSGNTAVEQPIETWELEAKETEKDLLDADFLNPGTLSSLSKNDRQLVAKAIGDNVGPDGLGEALSGADDFATAASFFTLMRAGVRSMPMEASSIRRSRVVSNRYAVKASYLNVGRLLSTATFQSLESVPSNLLFELPATPSPQQFLETPGDLQYAWRKSRPDIQQIALGKWQIIQRWQFGLWAVKMHGVVL